MISWIGLKRRYYRWRARHMKQDMFVCPMRNNNVSRLQSMIPLPDYWMVENGYKHCSFCGSMEPVEFFAALKLITADNDNYIEVNERFTKIYAHISNHNYKAYIDHLAHWCNVEQQMMDDEREELNRQIHTAVLTSHKVLQRLTVKLFQQ